MIELESHAQTKRSELHLGLGRPRDLAIEYSPKAATLTLKIAAGDKHNYVLHMARIDWEILNTRITDALAFLAEPIVIAPTTPPSSPEPPAPPLPPVPEGTQPVTDFDRNTGEVIEGDE